MLTGGYFARMSEQIEATWKLERISPRAYQHPGDRAATAALAKVPYLDEVVRRLVALGYERALRAASLGSAVRLGDNQLPRIWVLHRQVFNTLDIERVPDLYLTQFPLANAYAIGTDKPIVLLNSELVRILDDDGRRVVLAHEAAHVHSDHVLYQTALLILLRLGSTVRLPILAGLAAARHPARPARVVARGRAVVRPRGGARHARPAGGLPGADDDRRRRGGGGAQPRRVHRAGDGVHRGRRRARANDEASAGPASDPSDARPAREDASRLGPRGGIRPHGARRLPSPIGEEPGPRDEADSAGVYYADRVSGAFGQAGSSIADVGQQLGDWLKRTRERGDGGDGGGGSSAEG